MNSKFLFFFFVKNTRRCPASPAFFASIEQKIENFDFHQTSFIKSIQKNIHVLFK